MKTINKLTLIFSIMLLSVATISSCKKERVITPVNQNKASLSPLIVDVSHLNSIDNSSRKSCENDLINSVDNCTYLSGDGDLTFYGNDFVQKLNSCHVYRTVKYCRWLDKYKTISQEVYLYTMSSNECKSYLFYNNIKNTVVQDAENNAPTDYDIYSYDLIGAELELGDWILKLRINYRRNTCKDKITPTK